ncbi:MAG: SDR family oxidoreductase [Candidatus Nanopelagicales bacterium]|nr:SDR family oxidoreductase [Candidatus Nanopelagicales bacterium]
MAQGKGRTVLVTGGTKGWGRAIVDRFADEGAELFINFAHDEQAADQLAEGLRARGVTAHLIQADMGAAEGIERMFAQLRDSTEHLDVVVHNAFHLTNANPLAATREQWMRAMEVGPLALMSIVQQAAPMLPESTGRIIATSSVATSRIFHATQGLGYFPMAAAKGALEVSVRFLATELAPREITVNAVAAAYIGTEGLLQAPQPFLDAIAKKTPYGRIPSAAEMAGIVMMLASPDAALTTGQVIVADGGFTLV